MSELPEREKRALIASAKASVGSRMAARGVLIVGAEGWEGDMGVVVDDEDDEEGGNGGEFGCGRVGCGREDE